MAGSGACNIHCAVGLCTCGRRLSRSAAAGWRPHARSTTTHTPSLALRCHQAAHDAGFGAVPGGSGGGGGSVPVAACVARLLAAKCVRDEIKEALTDHRKKFGSATAARAAGGGTGRGSGDSGSSGSDSDGGGGGAAAGSRDDGSDGKGAAAGSGEGEGSEGQRPSGEQEQEEADEGVELDDVALRALSKLQQRRG